MSELNNAVIIDAVRTPVGTFAGALSRVRPDDLAALVLKALADRTGLDPICLEEVVLGCTNQAGEDNRNVARMALLLAGFPVSVAGITLNRLCASGLDAIIHAHRAISVGEGEVFMAGGVESMSRAPYVVGKSETAFALSLVLEKRFCAKVITDQKMQMIRRTGLMEFWPPVALDQVGGLDHLKQYLVNRKKAFEPGNEHLPRPKALPLVGIPGTGKSLSCKAEWEKRSEKDLQDIFSYMYNHAFDSPSPAKCK